MKLKKGFLLRSVAGRIVVVPAGDILNMNMMITLNGTGRFLWEKLEQETSREELIAALMNEYVVSQEQAASDVDAFLQILQSRGFLA